MSLFSKREGGGKRHCLVREREGEIYKTNI